MLRWFVKLLAIGWFSVTTAISPARVNAQTLEIQEKSVYYDSLKAYENSFLGKRVEITSKLFDEVVEIASDASILRMEISNNRDSDFTWISGTYISIPLGQILTVRRRDPPMVDADPLIPLVRFINTGGPTVFDVGEETISRSALGFHINRPGGIRWSELWRTSTITRAESKVDGDDLSGFRCARNGRSDVMMYFDAAKRLCLLTEQFGDVVDPNTVDSNPQPDKVDIELVIEYSNEVNVYPSTFTTRTRVSTGYQNEVVCRLSGFDSTLDPLPETIEFAELDLEDGVSVMSIDQPDNQFVLKDGVVVAVVDEALAQAAANVRWRSKSTPIWYYVVLAFGFLCVAGLLIWQRQKD
ncbi:hypothetical protein [Rhodopirellula europaea]|uniref:hypothetical protein n=1 Tax=Rhodopirellula europaea TaxID=1263866 RepID=UPI003D2705E5